MFQLLKEPYTGQYVHLVTGLQSSCLSDGIPDIQGLSSIDVHATQSHGIRKLHILPYLFLDQNKNYNAYSTLLHHEFWNVDQKMIILGNDFCYNTFSNI